MPEKGFSKRFRLRSSSEFQRVYKLGYQESLKYYSFFIYDNELGYPRVGIVVSSQVGKAVERNRIKRVIRELFRKNKGEFDAFDLIVQAHPVSEQANNPKLRERFWEEYSQAQRFRSDKDGS